MPTELKGRRVLGDRSGRWVRPKGRATRVSQGQHPSRAPGTGFLSGEGSRGARRRWAPPARGSALLRFLGVSSSAPKTAGEQEGYTRTSSRVPVRKALRTNPGSWLKFSKIDYPRSSPRCRALRQARTPSDGGQPASSPDPPPRGAPAGKHSSPRHPPPVAGSPGRSPRSPAGTAQARTGSAARRKPSGITGSPVPAALRPGLGVAPGADAADGG